MATYYKSRYLPPVVYLQQERFWRSYAPGGLTSQQDGLIPVHIFANLQEIGEREAQGHIQAWTRQPEDRRCEAKVGPAGLGGWLILPIIGLFVTPLAAIALLVGGLIPLFRSTNWPALTTPGSVIYHPLWAPLFTFEAFANVVLIVGPVVLLVLLFRKSPMLPRIIVWFYAFVVIVALLDAGAVIAFGIPVVRGAGFVELADRLTTSSVQQIVRAVALAAIWIPYFLLSQRVKNTFRKPGGLGGPILEDRQPPAFLSAPAHGDLTHRGKRRPRYRWAFLAAAGLFVVVYLVLLAVSALQGSPGKRASTAVTTPATSIGSTSSTTILNVPASSPGNYTTYTDDQYGYSFSYPASWKFKDGLAAKATAGATSVHSVGVVDTLGAASQGAYLDLMIVGVYKLNAAIDEFTLAQARPELEQLLKNLQSQVVDVKTIEPLTETTAGGMPGYKVTYGFTMHGEPVDSTMYFLFKGSTEYQVTVQAATLNWQAKSPIFDSILSSFQTG